MMRARDRAAATTAVLAGLLGALCGAAPRVAEAQAPAASAPAKAKAAPGAASALPPGHPAVADALPAGHPAVGDAMPPGHPAVGDAMPPGHPAVGDAMPPGHPSAGGAMPAGHPSVGDGAPRGRSASGFFEPPADGAMDDPSLPPGSIVARIADADDKPVAGAPVTLGILKSSVAKGDSREQREAVADSQGIVQFSGLPTGTGISYRVSVKRGPALYAVTPFALGDAAGKRVALHAYDVTTDLDEALIGVQAVIYVSLKEDSLQIEQLLNVFNVGPVTWVPQDVTMALPEGFKAFNKPEAMDDTRVDEVSGKGAALRGTFKPGQAGITFRYQVPLSGDERQSLRIEMPPHVAQVRIMAEASKTMGLEVTGFPEAQKGQNREGKRLLITEKQASRTEGGVKMLELRVSGLPTRGPGPWIAVGLGTAALVAAAAYVAQRRSDGAMPDDERADLDEAREALLEEIVALEKAHERGEVGPKAYTRIRTALVDALARIVRRLEPKTDVRPPAPGAYRRTSSS